MIGSDPDKVEIVFHLGYPKTATTYLQTNFFPIHPAFNYLGGLSFNRTIPLNSFGVEGYHKTAMRILSMEMDVATHEERVRLRTCIALREICFDIASLTEEEFLQKLEVLKNKVKIFELSKGKPNIISNEGFLKSHFHAQDTDHSPEPGYNYKRGIKRLQQVFGDAANLKFVVVVRNHVDMLYSYWNNISGKMGALYRLNFDDLSSSRRKRNNGPRSEQLEVQ